MSSTATPRVVTLQAADGTNETVEALASSDPTASTTQRRRFKSRFSTRWRTLRGDVRSLIQADKQFRPTSKRLPPSAKVADFRDWLERRIDRDVVETRPNRAVRRGRHWTAPFIKDLYQHGIERADRVLDAQGFEYRALDPGIAVKQPPHREVLAGLYVEGYHDLVDAGDAATKDSTRAYRDAVRSGASVNNTIGAVNDRLDKVGRHRTDLVAESKAIITINTAAAVRYGQVGVNSVGVMVETVPDTDADETLAHCCTPETVAALQEDEEGETTNDGEDTSWLPAGTAIGGGLLAGMGSGGTQGGPTATGEISESEYSWGTAGDQRVCPTCAGLAGSTYSISDILTGNAPMPVRSTHPGCRCFLIAA